ncbi:5'-nucleotidase [Ectothiorhodospiraceae bacterium BW-2]|nr:5'-nucleotidase [Ectothiorhodospiraceae bacterium BW-2]
MVDELKPLVIGVSSRALFDLEIEHEIFLQGSLTEYRQYQLDNEAVILAKGTAFHLVEALLRLNQLTDQRLVEVVVMSKNTPDTGLRIHNSIKHYQIDISRSAFSGGESLAPFLKAFSVDLLLTRDPRDVQTAIDTEECAAAVIYDPPQNFQPDQERIRLAFDADAVIISDDSEYIYRTEGLDTFQRHEEENEDIELRQGPFTKLVKVLSQINQQLGPERSPLKLAIVTARNTSAHVRVIKTLRQWGIIVDQAFALAGLPKEQVLQALRPHIYFDDQPAHLISASQHIPASQVPYRSDSKLKRLEQNSPINEEDN